MMRNQVLTFLVRLFHRKNVALKAQVKRLTEKAADATAMAHKYEAALFLAEMEIAVLERCKRAATGETNGTKT